ncbi:MAG: 23S rRNA (pseudouridine(1915)-N(3))-methyltransferase RlmH [Chitinophagaceae bacterium]|nr:23S rRNA (pseudouridine(1915)-N(3))-methyltransferase RlmH [Chitinophagaceae bacterium]
MKIILWSVGGKHESYVSEGIETFTRRIAHYFPCEWKLVPSPKNAASLSLSDLKDAESRTLLQALDPVDYVVLLDERGRMLTSPDLAALVQERAVNGARRIHFVIGGAFGVNDEVRRRADLVWQLSKLVFPHQLVRLILAEQVYRACTILRGEKYHHV